MASILGQAKDRVKTDLRLPKRLVKHVEACCQALCIPKNAFFMLAGSLLVANIGSLLPAKKRVKMLSDIEEMFQKAVSEARKAA